MFAVVSIPDFSLQSVLRAEPELMPQAVALLDPALPKPCIIQLTATARSRGVGEGLTASQAMGRCGGLIIKNRSPAREQVVTDVLLQTAYAFSPDIESTAPGVCTMDLKGLRLESDEAIRVWVSSIREALAQCGLESRIGVAATPSLASLAARMAEPVLVLKGDGRLKTDGTAELLLSLNPDARIQLSLPTRNEWGESRREGRDSEPDASSPRPSPPSCVGKRGRQERAFREMEKGAGALVEGTAAEPCLESFPIEALEPPPEMLAVLDRWGIRTIGSFLALGKDRVAERLGPAAVEWFDRVSPDSARPLRLVVPPVAFAEEMEFETEIETVEPLLFVLRRFVEQLSRRLELIYLVVGGLHLRLGLASGASYERLFKIPAPTGHTTTLFRMLQTHLETVRTDSPIISLRLEAEPGKPETHQFGLFETTLRDPNQFAETLARLTALCGPDRVGSPVLEATHRPDAFRMQAPEFGRVGQTFRSTGSPGFPARYGDERQESAADRRLENRRDQQAGKPALHSTTGPALRRFRPVVSARVEFRERRPVLFRSAIFNGVIAQSRGPFFSSGDWWDKDRWTREEWDVQTGDGTLCRIFRSAEGWFVEGIYD